MRPLEPELAASAVDPAAPPASARASLADRWRLWHTGPAWRRGLAKTALFSLAFALVLYPKVWLAPSWLYRLTHLDSVIDPTNPGLDPIVAEVRAGLAPDAGPRAAQHAVETVIYKRVPYTHDWVTYGVFDHLPTVDEVLARGTDDCDGRAVLAASTLRRLGYEAWLVTDLLHTWVDTPEGDAMAMEKPGRVSMSGRPSADGPGATRFSINGALVANLGRGLGYGVSVFPLPRIVMLLVAFLLIAAHPRVGLARYATGAVAIAGGLALIRWSGEPFARSLAPEWGLWIGLGATLILAGWVVIAVRRRALP